MFLEKSREFYRTDFWCELRALCKKLAGYTCNRCGRYFPKGERSRLHAHHRVSRPNLPFPTALDVLSNLECLCEDCHDGAHSHPIPKRRTAGSPVRLFRARRSRFR